jgi:FMN-dependent NADH-azoreductase
MKKILVIESSPRADASFSRKLTQAVIEKLRTKEPSASVKTHDLTLNPVPHLEGAHLSAFFTPPEKHTDADRLAVHHSEQAIAEMMEADSIVIGVPMVNFSIPSVLKAWIDHVVRAGRTFQYGAKGPEGLVKGKKVYLAVASGGVYSEGAMKAFDFTEPYLKTVLGFIGLTDITTFRVEGVAVPGVKETAFEKAVESIRI